MEQERERALEEENRKAQEEARRVAEEVRRAEFEAEEARLKQGNYSIINHFNFFTFRNNLSFHYIFYVALRHEMKLVTSVHTFSFVHEHKNHNRSGSRQATRGD